MAVGTLNDEALEFYRSGRNYDLEVALGNVPGVSNLFIIGTSTNIGPTFSDIQDAGGIINFPTEAETWEIVSDNTNDTSAGSGARTVFVTGLDINFEEISELVTMNGTTPVTLTNSWYRTRSMLVITCGSSSTGGTNIGNITLRVSGGGDTRLFMTADEGASNSSLFTIPAGKMSYPIQITYAVPKNEDVLVRPRTRLPGEDAASVSAASIPLYQGCCFTPIAATVGFPATYDGKFQAKSTNTGVTVTVLAEYYLVDIDKGIT